MDPECDAALAASPLPPEADGLPITRVEVRALIPAGHQLAVDGPLRVTELADHPLLISGEEFRSTRMLRAACQLAGITPNVIFECSVGHTIETLVLAGVGIGVLSGAVNRERLPGIHLRPLCDANGTLLTFDMNVAWIRGRPVNPALRAFIRDLSDFTEPLRGAGPARSGSVERRACPDHPVRTTQVEAPATGLEPVTVRLTANTTTVRLVPPRAAQGRDLRKRRTARAGSSACHRLMPGLP